MAQAMNEHQLTVRRGSRRKIGREEKGNQS